MHPPGKSFDGIELSLFSSRISAVCEEMGSLLGRVAFSPNIRDRLDYSCALFSREGKLLGQATHIPVHLGSMAFAMSAVIGKFDWKSGDAVVFNDPYSGGTHLPDVTFVAPVFAGGELLGFCANRAHHADIGAETPGSMPVSRTLDEEGIIIPPTRVVRGGERDQAWFREFYGHLRNPAASDGDFSAQLAANLLGCERTRALVAGMGTGRWLEQCAALQDYGRLLATSALEQIPEGIHSFTDWLDDDGFGHHDIPLTVAVRKDAAGVRVGFEGTAEQVEGNLNCPLPVTWAAVTYVFRCLMPAHVPSCHGALSVVEVDAPSGCVVNARPPAAVAAGNVETSMRIVDAVCGALATAMPGKIPAASQGTMNNIAMGSRDGSAWDYYETLAGGMGASPAAHGDSARHSHMTNTLNTPVEVLERNFPLRVLNYAVRRNSGGAGAHRGGDGIVREYLFLGDASVSILSERRKRGPWGLEGGAAGLAGVNSLDESHLGPKCQFVARPGQVLRIETPGGGGYGTP